MNTKVCTLGFSLMDNMLQHNNAVHELSAVPSKYSEAVLIEFRYAY